MNVLLLQDCLGNYEISERKEGHDELFLVSTQGLLASGVKGRAGKCSS